MSRPAHGIGLYLVVSGTSCRIAGRLVFFGIARVLLDQPSCYLRRTLLTTTACISSSWHYNHVQLRWCKTSRHKKGRKA